MPWFRVDDQFHRHPKAHAAGNAALGLWVLLGSAAGDSDHGGVIPMRVARTYGTKRQIERLLEVGLLDRAGDDLTIHDWADHQGARSDADRARDYRRRRRRESVTKRDDRVTNAVDLYPLPSSRRLQSDDDDKSLPPDTAVTKRDAESSSSIFDQTIRIAANAIADEQGNTRSGYVRGIERNLRTERGDEIRIALNGAHDPIAAAGQIIGSDIAARLAARRIEPASTHKRDAHRAPDTDPEATP